MDADRRSICEFTLPSDRFLSKVEDRLLFWPLEITIKKIGDI
jgi:hypothetical protein